MNEEFQTLYMELREMRHELLNGLKEKKGRESLIPLMKAEINDINRALQKLEEGKYGICEVTGKEIEKDLLMAIPLMQSITEVEEISKYLHKAISYDW